MRYRTVDQLRLADAIKSGHQASQVLWDVCRALSEVPCQEAAGFEGIDTYPDCGHCIICVAKSAAAQASG